jgi:hypothetical protein
VRPTGWSPVPASYKHQGRCHTVHLREVLNLISNRVCDQLLKYSANSYNLNATQKHALSIAKKLARRKSSHGTVLRWELIEQLRNEIPGLTVLEATIAIHQLVETGRLVLIQDSPFVKFQLTGTYVVVDKFEERRQRLVRSWLTADEGAALECYKDEERENENAAILRLEKEEQDQAREKKRQRLAFKHSEERRVRF